MSWCSDETTQKTEVFLKEKIAKESLLANPLRDIAGQKTTQRVVLCGDQSYRQASGCQYSTDDQHDHTGMEKKGHIGST